MPRPPRLHLRKTTPIHGPQKETEMIFQSKWRNARYIVRATQRVFYPDVGYSKLVPGLVAEFKGQQRLFDSEKSQRENGWTDDQRILVEDHLLGHRDWKRGLYLAPGQTVPADRAGALRTKEEEKAVRCMFVKAEAGEIIQCQKQAAVGRSFCAEHEPENKITPGMLTA